jgi:hypothetical protein
MSVRTLFVCVALFLVSACSHPIEIVGEGDVWSTGGRSCTFEDYQSGAVNCSKNYVVGAYQETYYAEPRPGWLFDRWERYCTNAPGNACSFDVTEETVRLFWGQVLPPLVAIFTPDPSGIPAADTVTVAGVVWAQPDLFVNLSWAQIMAVCPGGVFGSGATLNGLNMNGWNLASAGQVNVLFNNYAGECALSSSNPDYTGSASADSWGHLMFEDGFRSTIASNAFRSIRGLTSTAFGSNDAYTAAMTDAIGDVSFGDTASSTDTYSKTVPLGYVGAWFYRAPVIAPGAPITDIVVVDGKEWAQVDLFNNVGKFDMGRACGNGICSGTLNGYDMDGWTWATAAEVQALFDYYIFYGESPCTEPFCPEPEWFRAWWADGWRPTRQDAATTRTYGFTSGSSSSDGRIGSTTDNTSYPFPLTQYFATTIGGFFFVIIPGQCTDSSVSGVGGWFYRSVTP